MYRTGMLPPSTAAKITERRRYRTSDLYRRALEIRREREEEARSSSAPLSTPSSLRPESLRTPAKTPTP
jgi:hypothetical protein